MNNFYKFLHENDAFYKYFYNIYTLNPTFNFQLEPPKLYISTGFIFSFSPEGSNYWNILSTKWSVCINEH